MATFLDKLENKLTIHLVHVKRFHMVKRLWNWSSISGDIRQNTPNDVNTQRNFHLLACSPPKLLDNLHQNFTRYSGIRDAIIFCIYKALFHSISQWHSDKVDWSGKKRRFIDFGCHGNIPWKIKKKLNEWASPYICLPILKFSWRLLH